MHGFPRDAFTATLVRREGNYAKQHPNQTAPWRTAAVRDMGLFAKFCDSVCLKDASLTLHRPHCSTAFPCVPYNRWGFGLNDVDLLQVLSCHWVVIFGNLTPSGLCQWQTGDSGRQLRYRPEHTLTNCKWKEIMRYLITIKTCCFLLSPKHKRSYT